MDANESVKALQSSHADLKNSIEEVMYKSMRECQSITSDPKADVDATLSAKSAMLQDCVQILQTSKAVSDAEARTCSMWRTRCIELQAQRDSAIEVAAGLAAANGVEEAKRVL